jgi:hypothetical protein
MERPIGHERVKEIPGRPGPQRREQERSEDGADEGERRSHQRPRAMSANTRPAAATVASISAAPCAALTKPASYGDGAS